MFVGSKHNNGIDGSQKYRIDSRKKNQRMSQNFDGGTVMVWAGILTTGRTPICFRSNKMKSEKYIELLDDLLINSGDDSLGNNWIFQQDNAASPKSKAKKSFLSSRNTSFELADMSSRSKSDRKFMSNTIGPSFQK
ncbi:hypothetical protein DOY81_006865 [Sarcophaga bullata]|nr:hypothetical protein DOY81_006865 [Sarcophaga bullata]